MGQFYFDPSEYNVGDDVSDIANLRSYKSADDFVITEVNGTKVLLAPSTNFNDLGLELLDDEGNPFNVTDSEIFIRSQVRNLGDNGYRIEYQHRDSGVEGQDRYVLRDRNRRSPAGRSRLTIAKSEGGSFSTLADNIHSPEQTNVIETTSTVEGTSLSIERVVPDDPTKNNSIETTDNSLLSSGRLNVSYRWSDEGTYIYFIGIGTNGDPAPTEPVGVGAEEADVTTTQAAQLTSADTLVYRTLDAATIQALQTVSVNIVGILDASASTRQQQQRAEAAAEVVATITLDAVTRQARQGTAASVLLRAKIDALTRQQPQLAEIAAEIVGIISAAAETQQQPQRATADLQSTIRVSVGTQQQPQTAAATALVATILQTVTRQLPQRTTAAFGDLVRARIQATSIRRAIDLQTSITRP